MPDSARQVGILERVHLLKASSAFRDLAPPDLAVLASSAAERLQRRGRRLLVADEPVAAIHLLVEGRITVFRRGGAPTRIEAGELVGLLELCAGSVAGIDAVADTETLTLAFARETFLDLLEDHFSIFHHLLRRTCTLRIEQGGDLAEHAHASDVGRGSVHRGGRELDLAERIIFMRKTFPFARGRLAAIAELSHHVTEVHYEGGAPIWEEADDADHLLMIVRGGVRCRKRDSSEPFRFGPEGTPGTLEAVAGLPRWYAAQAEAAGLTALRLDVGHLLDIFEDNLDMGMAYLGHVAQHALAADGRDSEDLRRAPTGSAGARRVGT